MTVSVDSAQHSFFVVAAFFLVMLLFLLAWRKTRSVVPLLCAVIALVGWSLGTALEMTFAALPDKVFWDKLSQTSLVWLSVIWTVFLLDLVFIDNRVRNRYLAIVSALPLLVTVLAWTNDYHHLIWNSFVLAPACQCVQTSYGPLGWVYFFYDAVLTVLDLSLLAHMLATINRQQVGQVIILSLCTLAIEFTRFSTLLPPITQVVINLAPLFFIILAVLFLYGLMRYRILNITPIPYQLMIGGMLDGILVVTLENRIAHINPAAEAILMRSAREMVGQPVEKALAAYPVLLEKCRGDQELLETIVLGDGAAGSHYELHFNFLHDKYHRLIGKLVTLHNITKRVQAESASLQNQLLLKQSEEKYRSLVENINEVIFTMTTEGNFTYISPVITRHTAYQPEHLTGRSFFEFIHPEDLPALRINFKHALSGAVSMLEFRILNQNGSHRYVRTFTHPIVENGQTVGLQGVISDISETKQVEQALERRASQLAMLNFIGEQIAAVIELKDVLDSATRLIQKHFGYYHVAIFTPDLERGELFMRSTSGFFSELFPEDHHLKFGQGMVGWAAEHRTVLLANDVRLEPRYTNLYPDKILTRAELAVPILVGETMLGVLDIQSPLVNAFDENDVRVMETVADQVAIALENARLYEEVQRRADALEEANASLREMDRLKSQFLANMSHELRTPMNSIIGFSEVLVDEISGPLNTEQKEFVQDILESGQHLLALINDLLDFSKIEAGRMTLDLSTFDVQRLFEELATTIAPLIEKKSQALVFRREDNLPALTADHRRIKQVFINLLSNANKFTPDGGRISVSCRLAEAGNVLFTLQDTGIGIRKEDQELIFEEFRQVDGSMSREASGSGLGLTISKRIIELHQGQIWVESQPGAGSTFFIRLPVCCLSNSA